MTTSHPREERGQAGEGTAVTLADLHAANKARQTEWCAGGDPEPDLAFRGNELAGETGEACNVIKKLERERHGWRGSRATLDDLAQELADVIICADLCAITAGIDLAAAVVAKFNATSEKQGLATKLATAPQPAGAERVDLDRDHVANEIENIARAWRGANGGIYTIHAMSLELADWAIARSAPLLGSGEGTAGATAKGYRYSILLKWSDEDQAFVGRVPELLGCCFHGDTQVEAIGEAASAIACWIEAAEAAGNQVPQAATLGDADLMNWAPHPQSPSLSEVGEASTPDPVGEAKALLEGLPKWLGPQQWIEVCRKTGDHKQADRFEAALATLTASQEQDGEVFAR